MIEHKTMDLVKQILEKYNSKNLYMNVQNMNRPVVMLLDIYVQIIVSLNINYRVYQNDQNKQLINVLQVIELGKYHRYVQYAIAVNTKWGIDVKRNTNIGWMHPSVFFLVYISNQLLLDIY